MSFAKSKLKLARDSIGKKDFTVARDAATQVLDYEPENYTAHVFLALSLLKLDEITESEQVYCRATSLAPEQILAWQGLSQLYEQIGKREELLNTLETLARLHHRADDPGKTAETLQRIIGVARGTDDTQKLVQALSHLLPDSPFYPTLSKLPPPDPTSPTATTIAYIQTAVYNELSILEEIVGLVEVQEISHIEKETERRRTRLGAGSPEQIRREVGREVWAQSHLPRLYNQIMNHPSSSDELRRITESKLLRHRANYLHALPLTKDFQELKSELGKEVDELVRGIILLKIPDELAWTLHVEEQDCETMGDYDFVLMKQMITLLPNSALAMAFTGYFRYISEPLLEEEDKGEKESAPKCEEEDPFDSILNIYSKSQDKITVCRIAGEVHLNEEDYENASKVAKAGLGLLGKIEQDSGKNLRRARVGLQSILTTALVRIFPPKHHQRALPILREALSISPNNIRCLFSHAYILQTAQDWLPAAELYQKIADLLPDDLVDGLQARENQGWCHWQATHEQTDIESLKSVFHCLDDLEGRDRDAARCLWKIGKCYWDQGGETKEEAYSFFIASLKRDSSFAPAFTALGFYYVENASPPDPVRASKCFQKAFELDPRENAAAHKLAEGFAEDREWDLVEVVARRTIEGEGGVDAGSRDFGSSTTNFIPTNSWAWKAIGLIEMGREKYIPAIQAFQIALRAEPDDSLTWSRLGEVYSKAGRQAAAIKALRRSLELDPHSWLCSFLIGKLKSEMGLYQEAIFIFEEILINRPNELSVLVTLAQAHLLLGRAQSQGGYLIRAEASFFSAIDVALSVVERHPGFRGVPWKVISDAALQLCLRSKFQDETRAAKTSTTLISLLSTEHGAVLELPSLAKFGSSHSNAFLGISIYACNLRLALNSSSNVVRGTIWYDLAVGLRACSTRVAIPGSEMEKKVVEAVTNALKEEPSNELYWNAYGNVHFSEHPKVAQHAYVKALEINSKDTVAWTNLGFLYYYHGDLELANEALYRAQVSDPDYSLAWLGQALVATTNGHDSDARVLLMHATTLASSLPDVDAEYGIRVFYESKVSKRRTEAKVDLIPCFSALDRYCSRRPDDAWGLHLFALICEKIGYTDLAISLVTRSISLLEAIYEESENAAVERQFTIANTTLGRLLLSTGQYTRSLESFQTSLGLLEGDEKTDQDMLRMGETKVLRVQAHVGLALAQFMLRDYPGSVKSSQAALNITGEDLTMKGQIMVLLTQTLWALGTDETRETAKSQLLEYIAVDSENLTAINTLAGMGILTEDENLVDAALSEVLGLPVDQRQELDDHREVDYLVVQHRLSQGRIGNAISVAQKEVLLEPGKLEPRLRLASLVIQKGKRERALGLLAGASSANTQEDLSSTPIALVLHSVALCNPSVPAEDKARSLRLIQRAIMLRPFCVRSWEALVYVRSCAV